MKPSTQTASDNNDCACFFLPAIMFACQATAKARSMRKPFRSGASDPAMASWTNMRSCFDFFNAVVSTYAASFSSPLNRTCSSRESRSWECERGGK
ncbi:MAG: hypothetical protein CMJ90_07355 [Planctomycetes bacterium]|nr:hypothetical protein [Planctomycetota bacterium]